jgi:hypothetical protein
LEHVAPGAAAAVPPGANGHEAARQWFTRQGEGLQVIVGPRRQVVTKADFPYLLRKYPNYGWTKIDELSFTCYACLAWVPTSRLLGQYAARSIENWDHWPGLTVHFGAERGWKEAPCELPPYYPATAD